MPGKLEIKNSTMLISGNVFIHSFGNFMVRIKDSKWA